MTAFACISLIYGTAEHIIGTTVCKVSWPKAEFISSFPLYPILTVVHLLSRQPSVLSWKKKR